MQKIYTPLHIYIIYFEDNIFGLLFAVSQPWVVLKEKK